MSWQPPTKLKPLNFKPHPYCGCEYCVEEFYPDGSPRYDRSGNEIVLRETEPEQLGNDEDSEP